ncbi:MAG: branched-chain amino acid transaminase [Acidiferrobacteraceae bacterium]|nr:branched-chain amino acid transaminase [Acidiferrobacteraceae bacterium]MBT5622432.1 branched-chain amino acid transaminase [Acidiferrobacteraceae bacterium]MBT6731829.1 branched-chain amino acid transaminase [Acidiferrobacteraceae bacterium]
MMSFSDRDGSIWFDGAMVPWREAKVHVLTHTLHYGLGVFEGVRAYETDRGTAIFRLAEHTERFFRSAHILGMKMPYDNDTLNAAQVAVVQENGLESAYLRPLAFYGSEGMGIRADMLKTHIAIATWEWGAYLGEDGLKNGIRVRTSSFTRHHVNITMCRAKACGNYINSILALQEALSGGADEALMLDTEGYVTEGTGENIFVVRNGVVYTPDLSSALEGITRDTVIRLIGEAGLDLVEKRITRDEVYVADEAFFTGTAAEVTPISELDGRSIGNGGRGPVTEQLQASYFDCVHGRDPKHDDWLTFV